MTENAAMTIGTISLTPEEQALVDRIEFDPLALAGDHARYLSNSDIASKLMWSIFRRDAIPPARLAWFTDPQLNFGRLKGSRESNFRRNNPEDEEMIRHPHFLKYLRYFIFGADLPRDLCEEFAKRVADCYHVNGSDALELGDWARGEVRRRRMDGQHSAEEFHKLALDCGVHAMWVGTIYDRVKIAPPASRYR
ncbi:MAG: hypothetical protein J0J10_18000 [Bosea sp.]|uniref:hypothetical protein n=1 Tax=Bosea sp. (in: a-proteobacteria) TaxID=1871050 RepID=UPI001AC12E69|nr:hypothetical protein [Bosea sp. (in: a-proteobacteria)]MBN9470662.1 hypothetical protein [Bosea sp. (in: a-proteobacteria)]